MDHAGKLETRYFAGMNIRDRLKEARERLGLTIEDVGRAVGVSKQAVSTWENGKRMPPTDKLIAWAKAVGVELRVTADEPAPLVSGLNDDQRRMLEALIGVLPSLDRQAVRMLEAQILALATEDVKKVS